jgi:hypothetical protein
MILTSLLANEGLAKHVVDDQTHDSLNCTVKCLAKYSSLRDVVAPQFVEMLQEVLDWQDEG